MGLNVFEKLVRSHLGSGEMKAGSEISISIDQTLTQDPLGTMAYLQFEAMGIPQVKTRLSVSYVDHCMLQEGFENSDDHMYLQTVASKSTSRLICGLEFSAWVSWCKLVMVCAPAVQADAAPNESRANAANFRKQPRNRL